MTPPIPPDLPSHSLILGSRGSQLALAQAHWVLSRMAAGSPPVLAEIRVVKTTGDRATSANLASGENVGLFVREIEEELLSGRIDLAVHSLKDLPLSQPDGLRVSAFPQREDSRDVLVTRDGRGIEDLELGARIGTGSPRRIGQLLAIRRDLRFEPIRGNVDTRLRKLSEGRVDALVLAMAGMNRIGASHAHSLPLPPEVMLPAPGQGALAVEIRARDTQLGSILRSLLDHAPTSASVRAERAFLQTLGGGCQMPVGALGSASGDSLELHGVVAAADGTRILRDSVRGSSDRPVEAGVELGRKMIALGASELLGSVSSPQEHP
jgi:hydroxymethylbilane synthase